MAKAILDTDILSEYLKGHDASVAGHATRYLQDHGHLTFTSVTVYEIVYGLELKAAFSQLQKARAWLRGHEEVTPVADDYLAAASIKAKASRHGQSLELPDCLIAAVAIRLDVPLVTGNTADFQAIQNTGVNLITKNWRNP